MKNKTSLLTLIIFMLFTACTEIKDIDIEMDLPIKVQNDNEFIITVKLKNLAAKSQELVSIDIGDDYLKGIVIIKTEPSYTESIHVPIDNSVSYSFGKDIEPGDSIEVRFHCKTVLVGDFSDDIDFCINSDYNFLTKIARTIVE
jgi:LEA14-like dessication related protein